MFLDSNVLETQSAVSTVGFGSTPPLLPNVGDDQQAILGP